MRITKRSQQGVTLFMALILLILLTLLAVTTLNLGTSSLQIMGNLQHRNEALGAAQQAIETALSTTRLMTNPANVYGTPSSTSGPCSAADTTCVDVNGDGTPDVIVQLTPQPTCVEAQVVPNAQLNLAIPDDLACSIAPTQGTFGIVGVPSGNSQCTDSIWEIRAAAIDATTQTKVAVTEGAAIRVPNTTIATYCP